MAFILILKDEARMDMLTAFEYYELQQNDLGERFLLEVQKRFEDIVKHPEYYSFIDNKHILRDVTIGKFPYVIIYDFIGEEVTVYSVHATRRQPRHN